ncbi:1,4-alpha-glucan branching protein, partial [Streptomyces anulatus]
GAHDPVVLAQLRALLGGGAKPQQQNVSDTPDPTVVVHGTVTDQGADVRINRVLRPAEAEQGSSGRLVAGWTWPDGTAVRGEMAAVTPR